MCNRCYNIKAQMVLREMYKRLLDRQPTREEIREFSKNLPKPRPIKLPDSYKVLLEIELESLKGVALANRLKDMDEDEFRALVERIKPMLKIP